MRKIRQIDLHGIEDADQQTHGFAVDVMGTLSGGDRGIGSLHVLPDKGLSADFPNVGLETQMRFLERLISAFRQRFEC